MMRLATSLSIALSLLLSAVAALAQQGQADLSLYKTDKPGFGCNLFEAGGMAEYGLEVFNAGPSAASGLIVITDVLPAGLTFVSGGGGGWTCSAAGQTVTCTHPGPLSPFTGSFPITPAITVAITRAAYPSVTNMATVSSPNDPNPTNNTSTLVTPVALHSQWVRMTKADALLVDADRSGSLTPGDTIAYEIVVSFIDDFSGRFIVLDDVPDPNTTIVPGSVTTTLGSVTSGNTPGDTAVAIELCTLCSVTTGTQATVRFNVTIHDPLPPDVEAIRNQARLTLQTFAIEGCNPFELSDDPDTAEEVDETVTPLALRCEPLTQGFWKRQCNGSHPSGEYDQLSGYVACVSTAATFGGVGDKNALCDQLNPAPHNDKCEQAEAQFAALLLNLCSGRLSRACWIRTEITGEATVADAVALIDGLLSNPTRSFADCVDAQALADAINTAAALCEPATPW
jgi:uncharacterized repeat protein (TIGR01451 family)